MTKTTFTFLLIMVIVSIYPFCIFIQLPPFSILLKDFGLKCWTSVDVGSNWLRVLNECAYLTYTL